MNDLLKFAVEAHGGLVAWNAFSTLELQLSIGGAIWDFKQNPGLLRNVTYNMKTHREQVTITGFSAPDRRTTFVPKRLVLETLDGRVIEARDNPRASFDGQTAQTPWDKLHVAYFASYAVWTYFNSPFLYTLPGFETQETEPWKENGEIWRRLKITFPEGVASHVKEQVTYFGPDGLMRRHDYTVDILGGATGANYALNYREFQGIKVPTARRIFAYDANLQKVAEPVLVSIDVTAVNFMRSSNRQIEPRSSKAAVHRESLPTPQALCRPLRLGALNLPNRLVMAPLTRMRAASGAVPTTLMAEYYRQRATAGLIITEGTAISAQAQGFPSAPGIYTPEQIAAWRTVTEGVHRAGGRIMMQIAHNGRGSLAVYNADGSLPVAPSAIRYEGKVYGPDFKPLDPDIPRALETAEIRALIDTFADAAENAIAAGFDGVELQGANGHLIDQFLCDGSNQRSDRYGGTIEARARFLMEIVEAVSAVVGPDRLGVRLSPHGRYGGISDTNPVALFTYVSQELSRRHIAYLHLIEARGSEMGVTDELHADAPNNAALFRHAFSGPLISAAAYTPVSGAAAIDAGGADAIAFGRLFIANPDLVARVRSGAALNAPDRATFYGGAAHGYTDYSMLSSEPIAA